MAYATLAQVEAEIKAQPNQTNPNATEVINGVSYIMQALYFITARIDMETQQEFAPLRAIKDFDSTTDQALDGYLNSVILTKPLLDVIEVKVGDTVMTRWAPPLTYNERINYNYFLYPVYETPHYKLQSTGLFPFWSPFYFSPVTWWPQAAQQAIQVDGLWGYRTNYDTEAWPDSTQTVQNNPLTISGNSLTVADSSVFSPGMWIRFNDALTPAADEIAEVYSNDSPTEVTLLRGGTAGRGTTKTQHEQGCEIDIFVPEPNIQRACLRWAAYLYNRRNVYEQLKVSVGAGGSISQYFPQDIPEEIRGILGLYVNFHFAKA